jgi:hypothetical protein
VPRLRKLVVKLTAPRVHVALRLIVGSLLSIEWARDLSGLRRLHSSISDTNGRRTDHYTMETLNRLCTKEPRAAEPKSYVDSD